MRIADMPWIVGAAVLFGLLGGCQGPRRDYATRSSEQRTLHLEQSVEIDVARDVLSEFFADPCNEFLWQPWLREASMRPPTDAVGTVRRYVNRFAGKDFVNEYTTTVFRAR